MVFPSCRNVGRSLTPRPRTSALPCPGERRDAGVTEVQAQLGHSSLAVTTVYLAHLDARQLAEAMAEV